MSRSSEFSSPLSEQRPAPQTSSRENNGTRDARRSASSTHLQRPIDLKDAGEETEVVCPITVTVTAPDTDDLVLGSEPRISLLVPRALHTRPLSPTVPSQYQLSTSSYTTRSLDDLTRPPSAKMSRDSCSPSTLKPYYSSKTAPLSISQQTSASSSRDLALRKTHHDVSGIRELGPIPPGPSATSFHSSKEVVPSKSKFYKKRPPQLDLSLLFPKPQISTGGLLSPDKLVHSPQQLSPVSDTSSCGGATDSMWQICSPLRKALPKESLKSKDYSSERSKPRPQRENTKVDMQNLHSLTKGKVSTDGRKEIEEVDFVQRLAQNIQERGLKAPKPLDNSRDLPQHQGQYQKRGGTTKRSTQRQAISTPQPSREGDSSAGRGSPGPLRQKADIPKKASTSERRMLRQPRNEPLPKLTGRKCGPVRHGSPNSSGGKTALSKRSDGSAFSKSDLHMQSVLESSSSGDEGEVFGVGGEETEDDFIFQGKLEGSPRRDTESCSPRNSSKGSRKSSMMAKPKTVRHYVSFLRPQGQQGNTSRSRKLNPEPAGFRSWLVEMTPPASPESLSKTRSALTMAASQETRFLQAIREKRSISLGTPRTDVPLENLHDRRMSFASPERSSWLPLERNNSPQGTGQRLSGSKSSPSLRTEHGFDRSSKPLRSPSESPHWKRRTPSFVRTSSLPSPPSSVPSPITPPAYHAMPGQMINCLLSASTSPSSTLHIQKNVTDGTFLDPASPLLDRNWRAPSIERSTSRLTPASTSASSSKNNFGKQFGGRFARFDRLVLEDEEEFYTSEGYAYSDLDWKAA